jgi:cystathionine beta-synthase
MNQNQPKNQTPAVLSLIGNTPLIPVTRLDTGCCELFLKLESQNPGGSIKDRIGKSMIEAAEREGKLKAGSVIVEATAGNTGLGLALVGRAKGYRVVLVVPDKMASEKVLQLKALGAEVFWTRSDVAKGHPDYYQDYAARLAKDIPNAFFVDQFNNPNNPRAHFETTGPEIWQQMHHDVDTIVCGIGSSGTVTGLTRYFEQTQPNLAFVLADPQGSILADYIETGSFGEAGSWAVEGIGEDFIPPIADLSRIKHAYRISDEESFSTARELFTAEGILGGSSTGTLLAAALRYCRAQTTPKRVVSFVCDTGTRYLSKVYNDQWMIEQGLLKRPQLGDLRDLVPNRVVDAAVVSVSPRETLHIAFNRMRTAGVSQVPVLDPEQNGKIVGLLDETDLLVYVASQTEHQASLFQHEVSRAMNQQLTMLDSSAGLAQAKTLLDQGLVVIVMHEGLFYGLITRFDLLNYFRRSL